MNRYLHLVEACGDNTQQLTDLALLLAMAAYGMGLGSVPPPRRSQDWLDTIDSLHEAGLEIGRRLRSE